MLRVTLASLGLRLLVTLGVEGWSQVSRPFLPEWSLRVPYLSVCLVLPRAGPVQTPRTPGESRHLQGFMKSCGPKATLEGLSENRRLCRAQGRRGN